MIEIRDLWRAAELINAELLVTTLTEQVMCEAIDDYRTKAAAHLEWLDANPDEPDHDQQRAEFERAVELADKAIAILAPA